MPEPIQTYSPGTGLRPDLPDHRDFLYSEVMGAGEVNWEEGHDGFAALGIPQITQDQDGSLSCTAQAVKSHVRKHLVALGFSDVEISATPIYNAIMLPGGGAYLRDAIAFPAIVGSLTEATCPSYEDGRPPSEEFFRRFTMTDELRKLAAKLERFNYRMIPGATSDISIFAHAVASSCGGIGGYVGTNEGWCRPVVRPPMPGEIRWGHGVSHDCFGLMDVPDYGVPVGTRCLFTKNSWGDRYAIRKGRWSGYQAIPESYFAAGEQSAAGFVPGIYVFNAWVLVPDAAVPPSQKLMDFLRQHDGKLVQDSEQTGSFGLIKGGSILVAPPERVGQLVATYLVQKEGVPTPASIWNEAAQKGLIKPF